MAVEDPAEQADTFKVSAQTVRDVMGLSGAALASYGAWLHYPPLGFIVAGALLITLSLVGTLRGTN